MITTYGATEQADQPVTPVPNQGLSEEKRASLERLVQHRDELDPERRLLVEEAAKRYGITVPPAKGFTQAHNPLKEKVEDTGRTLKVAALPMGLQAAGIIGANTLSPGNVPLSIAAQTAGGLTGTFLNEKLGISNPDELDYLLSGSAPLLGAGIAKLGRRMIPG